MRALVEEQDRFFRRMGSQVKEENLFDIFSIVDPRSANQVIGEGIVHLVLVRVKDFTPTFARWAQFQCMLG